MNGLWKNSIFLFCALRASDVITLAGGLYLVPRFVSAHDLGAVLPVTSFATFVALPLFAFAMTVMKEASVLVADSRRGELKSLLRGTFAVGALALFLALVVAAAFAPRFLREMRVTDSAAGFLAIAAAFLGCVAPIFTDQLQSTRKFVPLGIVEIVSAFARLGVMIAIMPIRALAGYFAGGAALPAVRIAASVVALWRELTVPAERFWSRTATKRIAIAFLAILAYQMAPMGAGLMEQYVLRTSLPTADSAGYYMATRLSDLLCYLTLPLLLVLFPYTASTANRGGATAPLVRKCMLVTFLAAAVWAGLLALFGESLMRLIPNGSDYLPYVRHLPVLVLICALNAAQVFYTNTEVSAGRYRFLLWFLPLNLAYVLALDLFAADLRSLPALLGAFAGVALLRFGFCAYFLSKRTPLAP